MPEPKKKGISGAPAPLTQPAMAARAADSKHRRLAVPAALVLAGSWQDTIAAPSRRHVAKQLTGCRKK